MSTGPYDILIFNDVELLLFDKVIVFDHYKKKIILITNIRTDELETNYNKAQLELESLAKLVATGEEVNEPAGNLLTEFEDEFTKEEFMAKIETLQEHIRKGDIFQGVLSIGRRARFKGSLLNAYRILRTTNPSPYMLSQQPAYGIDRSLTGNFGEGS